jgi:FMN phosphatase YigB (HAD superfamily)
MVRELKYITRMAVKSLLLDIDGVLVRDRLLLEHVKDNCVKYVAAKLPEAKNPRDVNKILYMTHGHTARGLAKAFQIDTSDFNEKVYDKRVLDHLAEVIYGTDFQLEAKEVHDFTKKGWEVSLFTNAPASWAGRVARAIGDDVWLNCPGSDVRDSPLKPEATAYQNFSKVKSHVFVDDSLINLQTARWLPNWHPIHFSAEKQSTWCPTIGSIWELGLFLNTADFLMDHHCPSQSDIIYNQDPETTSPRSE